MQRDRGDRENDSREDPNHHHHDRDPNKGMLHTLISRDAGSSRLRQGSFAPRRIEHAICFFKRMQFNPAILRGSNARIRTTPTQRPTTSAASFASSAIAEIYAYIATRDMSVAEAERNVTDLTLNRAYLANELVENCLKPAASPYQAQCLPEADAIAERKRCETAKRRIGQLRACAAAAA